MKTPNKYYFIRVENGRNAAARGEKRFWRLYECWLLKATYEVEHAEGMRIGHPRRTLIFVAQLYFPFSTSLPPRLHQFCSHFPLKTLVFSMAEAVDNPSSFSGESDEDLKYGFQRPEMYKESITETVDAYDRHVFLCFKSPEDWIPRVEGYTEHGLLPKIFSSGFKARKNDIAVKVGFL